MCAIAEGVRVTSIAEHKCRARVDGRVRAAEENEREADEEREQRLGWRVEAREEV